MRPLERFFSVVGRDRIDSELSLIIAELEAKRNDARKKSLAEIDRLNVKVEGEKAAEILLQMNRDLTLSYEKETFLRDFIDRIK